MTSYKDVQDLPRGPNLAEEHPLKNTANQAFDKVRNSMGVKEEKPFVKVAPPSMNVYATLKI